VPVKTPKPVIATLNTAIAAVIPAPDIQAKAQAVGMEMRASTPDEMAARITADIAKWGDVIAKAGIQKRD
jgi:tripartite-type tricarboxylate transporter receptor subunit TctC